MRVLIPVLLLLIVACAQKPVPPSEQEIKDAASQVYMKINADIRDIAEECRGAGAIIVNPLKALKCTSACSFDPKNCEKLPVLELTDFKKLACVQAVGEAGWICDYQYNISTDSQFLMDMFTNLYGTDTQTQARFFQTEQGEWVMAKLK